MPEETTGVILLNMGGPDSIEAVRPFLYNLFSDRDIIQLGPAFLQKYIAAFIAWRRAPKSSVNYRKIGGKSPLGEITAAQAAALAVELQAHGDFYVTTAMRYWHPYPAEALDFLEEKNVSRLVVLTLYPQYSRATTGSSVKFLQQELARRNISLPVEIIDAWPAQPTYLQTVADAIMQEVHGFEVQGREKIEILYSAHSLPKSFVENGDPYVRHLEQSIAGIERLTGRKGHLCYQSRSGPVEWLAPSTPELLARVAEEGCKAVVMVPISFVSDHVETLYEIDMLYRKMAEDYGMAFASSASLNTNPRFIQALTELVLERS